MTKQIAVVPMPVRLAQDKHELAVQLRDPGIVRSIAWTLEERLVMTRGDAQFNEVLTMFVECAPNGPMRNRRFVVMPTGRVFNVPEGHKLEFLGTASSGNTGQVAHVYEVKETE